MAIAAERALEIPRPVLSGRLKASDIAMLTLEDEYVRDLFGYPGGASLRLNDSASRRSRLRHILVRDERGAGFAADGYARVSGEPGVVMTTSGPGATNLVTPFAGALMDSVPLVGLTGQVATSSIGFEAFQEVNVPSIFRSVTKSVVQVRRADQVQEAIREAFYIATSGRPGPTIVDIPKDVANEQALYQRMEPLRVNNDLLAQEVADQTDFVAKMLQQAERPIILAGHGVILSGATKELQALAEKTGIPVATTLHARGALATRHPLNRGMVGMHGSYAVNKLLSEADLVFVVGARVDDRASGKEDEFAPNAKIIHVNIDPTQRNTKVPAHHVIQASAKPILSRLVRKIQPNDQNDQRKRDAWLAKFDMYDKEEDERVRKPVLSGLSEEVTTPEVLDLFNQETQDESPIYMADVGQHQMFGALYLNLDEADSFFSSGGLGSMGYAIPAAIGAALAAPHRKVIALTGDGGARMNFQEMELLNELGLDVGVAVIDNGFLGMVRQWQELFYEGNYAFSRLPRLDWPMYANVFGVRGEAVSKREDLRDVVRRVASRGKPYLGQFIVREEEGVYPMVAVGKSNRDVVLAAA